MHIIITLADILTTVEAQIIFRDTKDKKNQGVNSEKVVTVTKKKFL